MKVAFVTHDVSIYGAARSLRLLMRNLPDKIDAHLFVPAKIARENNIDTISCFFGIDKSKIHEWYLPFVDCYVGKKDRYSWVDILNHVINKFVFLIKRRGYFNYLKANNFNAVHLNSIVLHPVVTADVPCFLHVREMWNGDDKFGLKKNLSSTSGVIFIDSVVARGLDRLKFNKSIVLNNPFDMSEVENAKLDVKKTILNKVENKIVISLVGRLTQEKGIDFIIDAFARNTRSDLILLIVGGGELPPAVVNIVENDNRILFLGEENKIEKIYAITDYLIRGEHLPRIGRTVFEALYSGAKVILPGTIADYDNCGLDEHQHSVIFYKVRDVESLSALFDDMSGSKPDRGAVSSNADAYVKEFICFVRKNINEKYGQNNNFGN